MQFKIMQMNSMPQNLEILRHMKIIFCLFF